MSGRRFSSTTNPPLIPQSQLNVPQVGQNKRRQSRKKGEMVADQEHAGGIDRDPDRYYEPQNFLLRADVVSANCTDKCVIKLRYRFGQGGVTTQR